MASVPRLESVPPLDFFRHRSASSPTAASFVYSPRLRASNSPRLYSAPSSALISLLFEIIIRNSAGHITSEGSDKAKVEDAIRKSVLYSVLTSMYRRTNVLEDDTVLAVFLSMNIELTTDLEWQSISRAMFPCFRVVQLETSHWSDNQKFYVELSRILREKNNQLGLAGEKTSPVHQLIYRVIAMSLSGPEEEISFVAKPILELLKGKFKSLDSTEEKQETVVTFSNAELDALAEIGSRWFVSEDKGLFSGKKTDRVREIILKDWHADQIGQVKTAEPEDLFTEKTSEGAEMTYFSRGQVLQIIVAVPPRHQMRQRGSSRESLYDDREMVVNEEVCFFAETVDDPTKTFEEEFDKKEHQLLRLQLRTHLPPCFVPMPEDDEIYIQAIRFLEQKGNRCLIWPVMKTEEGYMLVSETLELGTWLNEGLIETIKRCAAQSSLDQKFKKRIFEKVLTAAIASPISQWFSEWPESQKRNDLPRVVIAEHTPYEKIAEKTAALVKTQRKRLTDAIQATSYASLQDQGRMGSPKEKQESIDLKPVLQILKYALMKFEKEPKGLAEKEVCVSLLEKIKSAFKLVLNQHGQHGNKLILSSVREFTNGSFDQYEKEFREIAQSSRSNTELASRFAEALLKVPFQSSFETELRSIMELASDRQKAVISQSMEVLSPRSDTPRSSRSDSSQSTSTPPSSRIPSSRKRSTGEEDRPPSPTLLSTSPKKDSAFKGHVKVYKPEDEKK